MILVTFCCEQKVRHAGYTSRYCEVENVSSTRVADCIVGAAAALSFAVHEVKEIRAELHSSGPGGGV
jgi:hypothetical protein